LATSASTIQLSQDQLEFGAVRVSGRHSVVCNIPY